jgi:uncharacterized protein (TIGR00299 family) protein
VIAYLDCSTGVSGDKFLGALIDAGFDPEILRASLRLLGLPEIELEVAERRSGGVRGTGLTVREIGAPRRHYAELRGLLERAEGMPEPLRAGTLRALTALAEAEGRVHRVPIEQVHFHEIGAADTLVDTLGVALGLMELGIDAVIASPVATGSGSITSEHGVMAVPTPATALLLQGMPIVPGEAPGELTTPTGAALLRAHATFGSAPAMTLRRVGVGCGTRDLGMPNVCRLLVGEPIAEDPAHEDVVILESNIDHLTAEELAHAAERLREAGALDVWQTPIVMKKGRAATLLSALSRSDGAAALAERMLAETGTLGVRVLPAARRLVERDVTEIETSLGTARFKVARLPGRGRVLRVEADDAAALAARHGLAVDDVARVLETEASQRTGVQAMRQPSAEEDAKPSD